MPIQIVLERRILSVTLYSVLILASVVYGQASKTTSAPEWEKLVDAAKNDGEDSHG